MAEKAENIRDRQQPVGAFVKQLGRSAPMKQRAQMYSYAQKNKDQILKYIDGEVRSSNASRTPMWGQQKKKALSQAMSMPAGYKHHKKLGFVASERAGRMGGGAITEDKTLERTAKFIRALLYLVLIGGAVCLGYLGRELILALQNCQLGELHLKRMDDALGTHDKIRERQAAEQAAAQQRAAQQRQQQQNQRRQAPNRSGGSSTGR